MVVSGDYLARKVAGAHTTRVQAAPDNWTRAAAWHQRRLARLRGGEGESVSSSSRVNMKLMSVCQPSK